MEVWCINKQEEENIRNTTEAEIADYNIEKLEARLKYYSNLVSDMDDLIKDLKENLTSAAKQADIKESKDLKMRIKDAGENRAIFDITARVINAKLQLSKHQEALKLCGENPTIPEYMTPAVFHLIIDHIYEKTEQAFVGDPKSFEGKRKIDLIKKVIKVNPKLKMWVSFNRIGEKLWQKDRVMEEKC